MGCIWDALGEVLDVVVPTGEDFIFIRAGWIKKIREFGRVLRYCASAYCQKASAEVMRNRILPSSENQLINSKLSPKAERVCLSREQRIMKSTAPRALRNDTCTPHRSVHALRVSRVRVN